MNKLLIIIMVFLIVGCNKEESEKTVSEPTTSMTLKEKIESDPVFVEGIANLKKGEVTEEFYNYSAFDSKSKYSESKAMSDQEFVDVLTSIISEKVPPKGSSSSSFRTSSGCSLANGWCAYWCCYYSVVYGSDYWYCIWSRGC